MDEIKPGQKFSVTLPGMDQESESKKPIALSRQASITQTIPSNNDMIESPKKVGQKTYWNLELGYERSPEDPINSNLNEPPRLKPSYNKEEISNSEKN